MSVLVIADIINDELSFDQTGKTVSAVLGLGDITVLCACGNADTASKEAAKFDGVSKVLSASHESFANGLAESMADLIMSQAEHYEYVVSAATAHGKNILPRVAALLDVMVITDISKVLSKDTFERPIYAGNALQVVKSTDSKKIISIRTANFEVSPQNNNCKIETISNFSIKSDSSQWVEDRIQDNDRPELTSAKVIVSGGRGIGSEENFEIIEKLAVKLGAAVGASRAAVDSGYAPNDWQVGQTGKVVAPELSGAIQHLAGMKDSKVIVAINKDEEAPIFQVADYGLVGDLFTIVPDLANKL